MKVKTILLLCVLGTAAALAGAAGGYCLSGGTPGTSGLPGAGSAEDAGSAGNGHFTARAGGDSSDFTGTYDDLAGKYLIAFPTPTPVPVVPAEIAAEEDFSPYAEAVVDTNGYLNLPNNSVVEDVTSVNIKTEYFTFEIPGCWVGNVTADCRYINNVEGNFQDPVYDTLVVTFYEKKNYDAWRKSGSKPTDGEAQNGLLTELYFSSSENDNSWRKTSNYENYWATAAEGGRTYDIFLYEPHGSQGVSSDALSERYDYMAKTVNFEGCIIHSFTAADLGTVTIFDPYTEKSYIGNWDPDQEGIPEGSTLP